MVVIVARFFKGEGEMQEEEEKIWGVIYLNNGNAQPEIWSVRSMAEALQFAANFERNRLCVKGQAPVELSPPTKNKKPQGLKAPAYDWRQVRGGAGFNSPAPPFYRRGRPL